MIPVLTAPRAFASFLLSDRRTLLFVAIPQAAFVEVAIVYFLIQEEKDVTPSMKLWLHYELAFHPSVAEPTTIAAMEGVSSR